MITFAAGYVLALFRVAEDARYEEQHFRETIAKLRQRIYGPNDFHVKDLFPERRELAEFDPAKSTGSITLSYVGGMGISDLHLQLRGEGRLFSRKDGSSRLITTIPHDRCTTFFHRVLTSGILNYSAGIIELKMDLLQPNGSRHATDCPNTEIRVSIPELRAEKTISIYTPGIEFENFPDIIELQLITQIEREMLDLVPKDYPHWK